MGKGTGNFHADTLTAMFTPSLVSFLSSWLDSEDTGGVTQRAASTCCAILFSVFSQSFRLEATDKEIFQESESDINYALWRCLLVTRSQVRVSNLTLSYCFSGY